MRLVLEAIVLKEGSGFAGLPLETKKVLSSASSKAFCLWLCPIEWQTPSLHLYLATMPGIHERGDNILLPSDSSVRFYLQAVMDMSRRGGFVVGGDDWEEYFFYASCYLP